MFISNESFSLLDLLRKYYSVYVMKVKLVDSLLDVCFRHYVCNTSKYVYHRKQMDACLVVTSSFYYRIHFHAYTCYVYILNFDQYAWSDCLLRLKSVMLSLIIDNVIPYRRLMRVCLRVS